MLKSAVETWNYLNTNKFLSFLVYLRDRVNKVDIDKATCLRTIQHELPSAYKIKLRPFGFLFHASDGDAFVYVKSVGVYYQLCIKRV